MSGYKIQLYDYEHTEVREEMYLPVSPKIIDTINYILYEYGMEQIQPIHLKNLEECGGIMGRGYSICIVKDV